MRKLCLPALKQTSSNVILIGPEYHIITKTDELTLHYQDNA